MTTKRSIKLAIVILMLSDAISESIASETLLKLISLTPIYSFLVFIGKIKENTKQGFEES